MALRRQERKDKWEEGIILDQAKDTQQLLNAAAIGECQAYKWLEEMTLEKLQGEIEDANEE